MQKQKKGENKQKKEGDSFFAESKERREQPKRKKEIIFAEAKERREQPKERGRQKKNSHFVEASFINYTN